jgi:hypothetical protein
VRVRAPGAGVTVFTEVQLSALPELSEDEQRCADTHAHAPAHHTHRCCAAWVRPPRPGWLVRCRLIDDPAYRLTPAGWLAGWLRASGSWLPCESRSPVLVGGEPSIRAICPSTVRAQIRPVSRKCEHHPAHAHVLSLAVSSTAHVCLRAAAEAVLAPAQTRGAHNSWVMSRPL